MPTKAAAARAVVPLWTVFPLCEKARNRLYVTPVFTVTPSVAEYLNAKYTATKPIRKFNPSIIRKTGNSPSMAERIVSPGEKTRDIYGSNKLKKVTNMTTIEIRHDMNHARNHAKA